MRPTKADPGTVAEQHRVSFDVWQVPHLDAERRVVSGTAAGIAREIGIDPAYVRVSFVVLTLAGGWGVGLYLVAWAVMARRSQADDAYEPVAKAVTARVRLIAFAMVATGLVVLSTTVGLPFLGALVWPTVLVGAAVAIALDRDNLDRLRPLGDLQNQQVGSRVMLGLSLLFAGVIVALVLSLSFWQAVSGIVVAGLVLVGAGVVFAPIVSNLGTDLLAERTQRIRSDERAEMAAHLHDSVLQTLALIQKRSSDAGVVSLARRQERELRTWLFDDKAMNPDLGFRSELERQLATVEDLYQVPIEVVVVGDCPTDAAVLALLHATRQAAANAADHSGAGRVDVFAEVARDRIEVFVRDQGIGFDLDAVDPDRAGLRDSIIGRMERHGGTASVQTGAGQGTEVELRLPRAATPPDVAVAPAEAEAS